MLAVSVLNVQGMIDQLEVGYPGFAAICCAFCHSLTKSMDVTFICKSCLVFELYKLKVKEALRECTLGIIHCARKTLWYCSLCGYTTSML